MALALCHIGAIQSRRMYAHTHLIADGFGRLNGAYLQYIRSPWSGNNYSSHKIDSLSIFFLVRRHWDKSLLSSSFYDTIGQAAACLLRLY
jgi:hypothetical protein